MLVRLDCVIAHFEANISPITLPLIGATRANYCHSKNLSDCRFWVVICPLKIGNSRKQTAATF